MHILDHWRSFLLEWHFKIYTDHHSLIYLKIQSNLNQCQLCWMKWITDYNYKILYKSGKENIIINTLSYIHINTLSLLLNNIIRKSFIIEYQKNLFKNLIKEMKKKKEIFTWYIIENKLLYYQTDKYELW